MSVVSRAAARDYSQASEAVRKAVDLLGGAGRFASWGEEVIIKANMLSAHAPEDAVTTHPAVVEALIELAMEAGARPVVADSPGIGSAARVAKKCGILEVCQRHGVELRDLGTGGVSVLHGKTFRNIELSREVVEGKRIWNAAKWKTHAMTGMTLGVKNLYGCVPGATKVVSHFRAGRDREAFAALLVDIYQLIKPSLTVLDGITAMEGPGPSQGTPIHRGLILASSDAHALDWEAVRLSSFSPDAVPTIAVALANGLFDPDSLEVLGDEAKVMKFKGAPGSHVSFGILPAPVKKFLKKVITPAPKFDKRLCNGCGTCSAACPSKAITNGTPARVKEPLCIRCYCCQELCPRGAVWIPKLFGRRGS
ncbi:DUF362 domain-containing protein [bacterium]|nr:MAG: DUF362 domain-containing protein [bacterium]